MKPIHSVHDLLDIAARNACSAGCSRAVKSGTYTKPKFVVLPWGNHGWTLEVKSQSGARWSITVEVREAERTYRVHSRKVSP